MHPRRGSARAGSAQVSDKPRPPRSDGEFLARPQSGDVASAWRDFLGAWAGRMQRIVQQHVRDADDRADCFLVVCERLAGYDCRRLRQFDPAGTAQFSTWLTVVVTWIVIDWTRSRFGRERPFANIGRLPELELRLFHHRHTRRRSREDIRRRLEVEFCGVVYERLLPDAVRNDPLYEASLDALGVGRPWTTYTLHKYADLFD